MAILRNDAVAVPENTATEAVRAELETGMRNDIFVQYEAALRDRYPVEINNAAIATLLPSESF
jgi:hypothetical protein